MADDIWTCPECHDSAPYFEIRKGLDPRMKKSRVICGDCKAKFKKQKKGKERK